ncbi:MAG: pentapeptide repeat-containing protein [Methanogenium sp.]|jgi:hypothetical protein
MEIKNKEGKVIFTVEGNSLVNADLRGADLQYANLRDANLWYANLQYANLRYANLRYADLDFSCFPLWCGSFKMKANVKFAAQLAYHFCRIDFGTNKEAKEAQKYLKTLANKFHRVDECGKIE